VESRVHHERNAHHTHQPRTRTPAGQVGGNKWN
jgi:hypothetical protein